MLNLTEILEWAINMYIMLIQSGHSDIYNSSSGHFFSLYKTDFGLVKYLTNLKKCRMVQRCLPSVV